MERERDRLVPTGEAFGGLDWGVLAIRGDGMVREA